jgi:MFS family permease
MAVLVGTGERMAERFLPLYLVVLGGGALSVGLLNALDNLLGALYAFPGGYLSDRIGTKRALLIFNLIAMFGFSIVIVFPAWQAVLVGACFFISWTAISQPTTLSLIAQVLPSNRQTMGVSLHSLVRRVPKALGPLLGGWLIATRGEVEGVRVAFVIALLLSAVSLVLQQFYLDDDRPVVRRAQANPWRALRAMSPALRRLLVADILIRFCEQIPYAFVVLWAVQIVGISPAQFGVLSAVEMVVAMLVYIPVAYFADRSTKKPFVVTTFVFFTLFPLLLLIADSHAMLWVAFLVRGLKEFGEPTRKSLILELCPQDSRASSFGAYYLSRDVVVSVAAFGGALLWQIAPQLNFLVAFARGLAGTLYFARWGRDLRD